MEPSLDTWTTFFLLAAGQGLFLALVLFFNKKGNHRANQILGIFIFLFSLTLFDYLGFWTRYHQAFPYFASIYQPVAFLFGPLLYFYFRSVESDDGFQKKDLLHFLPFALFVIYRLPFFAIPASSKIKLLQGTLDEVAQSYLIFPYHELNIVVEGLTIAHLSFYVYLIYLFLRDKRQEEDHQEEDSARIKFRWYKTLLWLYSGFIAGYLFYFILVKTPYFTLFYDYSISLAMTVFIYTVGLLGYKRPEIFSGHILRQVFLAPKYQNSSLTPRASQSLLERVLEYVEQDKPYLDNELRLSGLAEQLDISTHHLSQVINEQMGKSFSDFINEYRVEEARRMLANPKNRDLYVINIAYSSGFNNKTSFNKAFKDQTGMSPSQYRKKALASGKLTTERRGY